MPYVTKALEHVPIVDSLHVFLNSIEQRFDTDYLVEQGNVVRMLAAADARTGDLVEVNYAHVGVPGVGIAALDRQYVGVPNGPTAGDPIGPFKPPQGAGCPAPPMSDTAGRLYRWESPPSYYYPTVTGAYGETGAGAVNGVGFTRDVNNGVVLSYERFVLRSGCYRVQGGGGGITMATTGAFSNSQNPGDIFVGGCVGRIDSGTPQTFHVHYAIGSWFHENPLRF